MISSGPSSATLITRRLKLKTHILILAVAALSVSQVGPLSAAIISGYGAFAEVRTCQNEVIGCPGPGGTDETVTVGGEFTTSANVTTSSDNKTGTSMASVAFTNDVFTPRLKAFASTDALSSNAAEGVALAIQSWTYQGDAQADFSISIQLDGNLDSTAPGSDAEIRADIAAYVWDDAEFFTGEFGLATFLGELLPGGGGTLLDRDTLFLSPTLTIDTATFDFLVNPGDQLYVLAQLEAKSERGGIADASSTLEVRFTGGNTDLLDAVIQPQGFVPAPATTLLLTPFAVLVLLRSRG